MNRAIKLIQSIEEATTIKKYVHPDHVSALEKRLKEKHIHHKKDQKPTYFGGIGYSGFGVGFRDLDGFNSCCDHCQSHSSSPNEVCAPSIMSAGTVGSGSFSGGGMAGGAGGAGSGSVGGGSTGV